MRLKNLKMKISEKMNNLFITVWVKLEKAVREVGRIFEKWQIQLLAVLIPLVLGFIGYSFFYQAAYGSWSFFAKMPLYSTIKLFAFAFDAKPVDGLVTGEEWWFKLLFAARWLALFVTGSKLFQLLTPLNKYFFAVFKYHAVWGKNGKFLIIGNNEENRIIYRSAREKDEKSYPMIVCSDDDNFNSLRRDDFNCIIQDYEKAVESAVRGTLSSDSKSSTIIINTKDEEMNLRLCDIVIDTVREFVGKDAAEIERLETSLRGREDLGIISDEEAEETGKIILELKEKTVRKLERLHAVVFGGKLYETAYYKMEKDSFGTLRYTNIPIKIAMDLISNYPLTSFINRDRFIDRYGCIDKNFGINVIFVGFRGVNQELFTSSIVINQFLEKSEPGEIPHVKKVNYYAYDKADVRAEKNLNHTVFRFSREFLRGIAKGEFQREDYLEIPPDPADITFIKTDINDPAFYERIRTICTDGSAGLNVISIALGNDLVNIDLAQKLADKVREWGLADTHILANIKDSRNSRIIQENQNIIPFGSVKETALDPDHVFYSELEEMAGRKNYMNTLINTNRARRKPKTAEEMEIASLYEWHTYDADKKLSSLYAILSLRSKLQLMGLDYRKKSGHPKALKSNRDYFEIYAKDDGPEPDQELGIISGKEMYRYSKILEKSDLCSRSLRLSLAIQEHLRWNAFMVSRGFVPASRQKIMTDLADHGRDYKLRTHGNLTTEEGLIEFRKLVAISTGITESSADVINYDFHLMDDAWWFLDMFGYEVYRR